VGSCSAAGQCLSLGSLGAECGIVVTYCACDGTTVGGLCGPDYAYAPTLGGPAPCGPAPTSPSGGAITTLASLPQSAPEYLAVDAVNVYVAALGDGTIVKVPIGGGPTVTLASGQNQPTCLATDGTNVYWTNQASGTNQGTVMKVPVGGGAATTLASVDGTPFGVAIDATNVYFTNISGSDGVMKVPIAGGEATLLAAASNPWAIAVAGTTVYYTDGDSVMSVPAAGGAPVTIAADQQFPYSLAVDAKNLYWSNERDGTIVAMPLAGGPPTTLTTQAPQARVATDGTNLYFTTSATANNAGSVESVPVAGGTPVTLATGQTTPEDIVVDATSVYWVDTYVGAVMKLTPK
jgi:hypothetical protein